MTVRSAGILLHPTSLANDYGIGDLGPAAFMFADFLADAGQGIWQILPLTPTDTETGNSPYHGSSAFAGNPLLISPELLVEREWINLSDLSDYRQKQSRRVDFPAVAVLKYPLLEKAYINFTAAGEVDDFKRFCATHQAWLDDYALYAALRAHYKKPWHRWPKSFRERDPETIARAGERFFDAISMHKFFQYLFFSQWRELKNYCNEKSIRIIGDLPIYLPFDSADVWVRPEQYKLDRNRRPLAVSGVPPDYFSKTGQLWGHPVYDWEMLRQNGYDWWIRRFEHNFALFDAVRIDHFRGLVAFWEVPAGAKTAVNGKWVPAPCEDFFSRLVKRFGNLPVIAEDLGTITADVREIIRRFDLPGMRVLQFAFGDDFAHSVHLPHFHVPNCVAYTGTHDNNTLRGWYESEAGPMVRRHLHGYLGRNVSPGRLHWEMIRMAWMSVADTAVVPMQDLLGLGKEARMNRPAESSGNWEWRMEEGVLTSVLARRLREMTLNCAR